MGCLVELGPSGSPNPGGPLARMSMADDTPHAVSLLPTRPERPRRRAADQSDELASPHRVAPANSGRTLAHGYVRTVVVQYSKIDCE